LEIVTLIVTKNFCLCVCVRACVRVYRAYVRNAEGTIKLTFH